MRKVFAGIAAAILASVVMTTGVLASPWQQQVTTCLWSNKLLPAHIYVNTNSGKVRCIPD